MTTKTPSKLEKILREGHLAVTSECGPPRGSNIEHITKKGELIKDHVDAINITDNQTSMTRLCSLAACIRLKLMGLEPVLQMVTRDRNRIALQSDILGAASFDINNILCLSGDHQSFGDCPQGQNVHDIDSIQESVPWFDHPKTGPFRLAVQSGVRAPTWSATVARDALTT